MIVNNAGIYRRGAVDELSLDDVDLHYRINQRAVMVSVAQLMPLLTSGSAVVTILERTFLGRIAQPNEITAAVLLLAGEGASYITGAELLVERGTVRLTCDVGSSPRSD